VKELENTDNQIGEQAPIEEEQKPVVHNIVNEEEE